MKSSTATAFKVIHGCNTPRPEDHSRILPFNDRPCRKIKESVIVPHTKCLDHLERFRALDEHSLWLKTDFRGVAYSAPDEESKEGVSVGFAFTIETTQLDMMRAAAPELQQNESSAKECADVMLAMNMLFSPLQVSLFLKECYRRDLVKKLFGSGHPNVFPVLVGQEYRLAVVRHNTVTNFEMKFSSISQGRGYHPGAIFHTKNAFDREAYERLIEQ